jgi:hypothetical protein
LLVQNFIDKTIRCCLSVRNTHTTLRLNINANTSISIGKFVYVFFPVNL